ncbi:MAG: transposase [Prevotella sp.]|nr:transposase [Prevotella sp.]
MTADYPERKEHRLKGFDYSAAAFYFVTIVTQDRQMLFGHIDQGKMHLNEAGKMISDTYTALAEDAEPDRDHLFTVMPNHIHFILMNPLDGMTDLRTFVQQFKRLTTNSYMKGVRQSEWPSFEKRLWQRNYYDHIIRYQQAYINISEYIRTNPQRWSEDCYFG